MKAYERLLLENKAWAREKVKEDPEYFNRLAKIQTPEFLWIGCSDSRVPANEVTNTSSGEIFVHRNIANVVVHTDLNVMSVVEYAVNVLGVKHIIVCGHYGCGGVKAALHPSDMGQLNNWLQTLRDVRRLHYEELQSIADEKQRFDRLVELNVYEQCMNIIKIDHVQKSWYKTGFPKVHGWIFDVRTGKLRDLGLSMEKEFMKIREIYDVKPLLS